MLLFSGCASGQFVGRALDRLREMLGRLCTADRDQSAEDEAGHAVDAGLLGGIRFRFDVRDVSSLASSLRTSSASRPHSAAALTSTARSVRSPPSAK